MSMVICGTYRWWRLWHSEMGGKYRPTDRVQRRWWTSANRTASKLWNLARELDQTGRMSRPVQPFLIFQLLSMWCLFLNGCLVCLALVNGFLGFSPYWRWSWIRRGRSSSPERRGRVLSLEVSCVSVTRTGRSWRPVNRALSTQPPSPLLPGCTEPWSTGHPAKTGMGTRDHQRALPTM